MEKELEAVESFLSQFGMCCPFKEWNAIRKYVEESTKTPNNKQSTKSVVEPPAWPKCSLIKESGRFIKYVD